MHVVGGITEVFVDVKPSNGREVAYKEAGEVVDFPSPKPEFGYLVRCHVQATTDNITVVMRIGGREMPGKGRESTAHNALQGWGVLLLVLVIIIIMNATRECYSAFNRLPC